MVKSSTDPTYRARERKPGGLSDVTGATFALPARTRRRPARPPAAPAKDRNAGPTSQAEVRKPAFRRLRSYAFDPSLSIDLDTAVINDATLKVPWEDSSARAGRRVLRGGRLRPGERRFYEPVDLNDPHLLAQDGLRAVRRQSAVPPADGLRGGDDDDPPLRAGARPQGAVVAALSCEMHNGQVTDARLRPAAAHLPARAARGQRLLQPGQEGAAVRLFPGVRHERRAQPAGRHGVHLPVARHHRPRDDARPARRDAPALHRAEQTRRARLPRGVRRHRGPVPALHASRSAPPPDRRRPAATSASRTCSASWPSSSARRSACTARCAARSARSTGEDATKPRPDAARAHDRAARPRRDPGGRRVRRLPRHLQGPHRRPAADRHRSGTGVLRRRNPSGPGEPPGRARRPRPQRTCCRCASARSTTARRSTSRSASTCAP